MHAYCRNFKNTSKKKNRTFRHPNLAIQKLLLLTFLIPIYIAVIILTCTRVHTQAHTQPAQADEHWVPLELIWRQRELGGAKCMEARGHKENEGVSRTADTASGSQPAPEPQLSPMERPGFIFLILRTKQRDPTQHTTEADICSQVWEVGVWGSPP